MKLLNNNLDSEKEKEKDMGISYKPVNHVDNSNAGLVLIKLDRH